MFHGYWAGMAISHLNHNHLHLYCFRIQNICIPFKGHNIIICFCVYFSFGIPNFECQIRICRLPTNAKIFHKWNLAKSSKGSPFSALMFICAYSSQIQNQYNKRTTTKLSNHCSICSLIEAIRIPDTSRLLAYAFWIPKFSQ